MVLAASSEGLMASRRKKCAGSLGWQAHDDTAGTNWGEVGPLVVADHQKGP